MLNLIIDNWLVGTLWVVRQADDPFVCFGAKPNKGLSSRSSTRPEVGKGTPVREVGKRNREKLEGRQAKGDAEGQSTTDSRRDQSGESRGSEEDRQNEFAVLSRQRLAVRKTVKDVLAFLVACRSFVQILVIVSLQIHMECSVTKPPFFHFELTQAYIVRLFFVLFLPLLWLYFLWP